VRTEYGIHIIKLTDKREAGVIPFAEVREEIESDLEYDQRDQAQHVYLDDLKKKAKIEMVEHDKTAADASAPH
jgi:peptidyl-prolyl cis-trans isomerase C